jgi:hypothetical protein
MNRLFRNFICEPPVRLIIKAALTNSLARQYAFEWAALFDAFRLPWYAVGLQTACKYAGLAGIKGFTAVEFGVAGGNGLIELSKYASRLSEKTGLKIQVAGFDTGAGLPPSGDRRDAPWLWNAGDFPCDVKRLREVLPSGVDLVLGRIEETLPGWLETITLPVGFISIDVDLYSATAAICETMGKAPANQLLPFVSCYFDDIHRYLTPECVGEMAAISEFNREHQDRQFSRDNWLCEDRPYGDRFWLKRMYSLCCFDHPVMRKHQSRAVSHLDLILK